jgi:16S rRNA (guanine966-N2)-methyltransferase
MLFNILGARIPGARVLDLYAGSGAIGLEALSRGAEFCIFVEQNAAAAQAIRTNLRTCGWTERAQVWHTNVKSAFRHFVSQLETGKSAGFDLVFADPPFTLPRELSDLAQRLDNLPQLLHNVGEENSALLVIQHHRKSEVALPKHFTCVQERRAGESLLSFFEIKGPLAGEYLEHEQEVSDKQKKNS